MANRYILHYGWRMKISPQKYDYQKFFISFFSSIWVAMSMGRNGTGNNQESESCSVVFDTLWPHGLFSPWNSLGHSLGVGSLSLLQGIFPTQGPNPGLPHCRWILYQLSHQESPRILERYLIASPADLPDPGIQPGSPALQAIREVLHNGLFLVSWLGTEREP